MYEFPNKSSNTCLGHECQTDTKYAHRICGNSMVMTTFLGAGYSTWRADTTNSVF